MTFLTIPERLLTWLDVERIFKQKTELWSHLPSGVHSIRCFSDGADIYHSAMLADMRSWLSELFGRAYDSSTDSIRLRIGETPYPLTFLEEKAQETTPYELPTYPLWRDVTYLKQRDESEATNESQGAGILPAAWPTEGPRVVSFHSFKGGVGRTTSLMTYVAACLQDGRSAPVKLLVIDADLEAPGVSFWLDEMNRPQVSFVQFLEAMHYPPVSVASSLDFFAQELRKTSLNVEGAQRELFVLPAALELTDIQDMQVEPKHLASNPKNPWVLTDHLHALGAQLGVDAVFVDLRAGLSELASPLLFDSRVEHFFVTTIAAQSVAGMSEVLKRLHAFNSQLPTNKRIDAKPSVILSMLTPTLRELPEYAKALDALGQAYPAPRDETMASGFQWLEADFSESLMSISSIRQALDVLKQSSLRKDAQEWATSFSVCSSHVQQEGTPQSSISSARDTAQAIYRICERIQFAERDTSSEMLITEPLRNLGKHYASDLPNTVIVGAKGAGKTFTFRQVINAGTWHEFLRRVDSSPLTVADAVIFPILWSQSLDDTAQENVRQIQQSCLDKLGNRAHSPIPGSQVKRLIDNALSNPASHWDDFWNDLICQQFGLSGGNLAELNEQLTEARISIILTVDGVEDAFDSPDTDVGRNAIQSLLRLPNRLGEIPNRHLGSLLFVRADYVQAAIRQNLAQFLSRYAPFQLHWNPESFLRLAYWLCGQAGIIDATAALAESLPMHELLNRLERLWGKKLGGEASKEAHSTRWVYAALCDLRGRFQARDLVRFLRFAAEIESSRQGETWTDRILAPESMRKAIPRCSQEKVEEAATEIAPLRSWRQRMQDENITERRVPFSAAAMLLNNEQQAALQELGVIYEDTTAGGLGEARLYLPEIYRTGLGFETSVGGRPRTQALLKKNLGSIPF